LKEVLIPLKDASKQFHPVQELDWDECDTHYNRQENEANSPATQPYLWFIYNTYESSKQWYQNGWWRKL